MIDPTRVRHVAMTGGILAVVAMAAPSVPARAQQIPNQLPPAQSPPRIELPQSQASPERYGDWTKKCETRPGTGEQTCFLRYLVVHQQNEKRRGVLLIAVGYFGKEKSPGMVLKVPLALGVYLPTGMTLSVPSVKPIRIVFESCLPGGCSGSTALSDDVIAAMKKANSGTVDVQNIRKQKLQLPVSFKGFTAGLAALDKG